MGGREHKGRLIIGAAVCLCAAVCAGESSARRGDTRVDTNMIVVHLTAVDKDGAALTTLRPEDVRVLEEGAAREVTAFEPLCDAPLELTLALDVSASQEKVLPASKAAAKVLVNELLRTDKERAAVYAFATEGTLLQSLTLDHKALHAAIDGLQAQVPAGYAGCGVFVIGPLPPRQPKHAPPPTGATSLWDALQTLARAVSPSPRAAEVRRVLVLFTDGEDTASAGKKRDAIESLVRAGVSVYVVGMGDENCAGLNLSDLRRLAKETGGRAYFPRKVKELQTVVDSIRAELSAQYLIAFKSGFVQGSKPYRKVQIEIVNPDLRTRGLQLAYPRGYFSN